MLKALFDMPTRTLRLVLTRKQFGIAGDPEVSAQWKNERIDDDPGTTFCYLRTLCKRESLHTRKALTLSHARSCGFLSPSAAAALAPLTSCS